MFRNPAAIAAAAQGDWENALIANTPGGIEAQERAGQAAVEVADVLPMDSGLVTRGQMEAIGFRFGEPVDELFVNATLPPGWTKEATENAYITLLRDERGRIRAEIFYKAAFYDRRADLHWRNRYRIYSSDSDADGNPVPDLIIEPHRRIEVRDYDEVIAAIGVSAFGELEESSAHYKMAEAWLDERFPAWRDPMAYW